MTLRDPLIATTGAIEELSGSDRLEGMWVFQGAWSSATNYIVNDVVTLSGASYICIAANSNEAPPNATYWALMAAQGATGGSGGSGTPGRMGGIRFTFDSNTTTGDPGAGKFRINSGGTSIYISATDADSNNLGDWLTSWNNSTATPKAVLFMQDMTTGSIHQYELGGYIQNSGWYSVSVTQVVAGTTANGDDVAMFIQLNGNTGATGATGADGIVTPGGRLTLSNGVTVQNSDVPNATTIYYQPHTHQLVYIKVGSDWVIRDIGASGVSASVPSATSSAKPFDVFLYDNSGTLTLEFVEWSSTVARATALARDTDTGLLIKDSAATHLYLGTIRCTTGGQCNDTLRSRHVWNMYNRVVRPMYWAGPGTDWTYNSNNVTRYVNGGSAPSLSVVNGLVEDIIDVEVNVPAYRTGTTLAAVVVSIGEDSTAGTASGVRSGYIRCNNGEAFSIKAEVKRQVALGYHEYNWIERCGSTSVTLNCRGSNVDEAGMSASFPM
jgi:hypothetical protein